MARKTSSKATARSGRFATGAAREANAFTNSVKFDTRLAHQEALVNLVDRPRE